MTKVKLLGGPEHGAWHEVGNPGERPASMSEYPPWIRLLADPLWGTRKHLPFAVGAPPLCGEVEIHYYSRHMLCVSGDRYVLLYLWEKLSADDRTARLDAERKERDEGPKFGSLEDFDLEFRGRWLANQPESEIIGHFRIKPTA